jgi:RNA polymerase sigma-70 factor (ECF subfamily)
MTDADITAQLQTARAGDEQAFARLTEPYRRELLVHCYRMLGSFEDAEDILQETLLRTWRRLDSYEGRAPFRAWLYKIATHASLDALDSRRPERQRRWLPTTVCEPAQPDRLQPPAPAVEQFLWIEPLPEALADESASSNPAARYEASEGVTLAFLAALQYLPGRQRAVLILREVLAFSASETAEILDMTAVAVNSSLQRARATMKQRGQQRPTRTGPLDEPTASLLARYVQAWERADSVALVALLREDAALTMPPMPLWYRGRDAIRWFLDDRLFTSEASARRFRLLATRANGGPAFGVYERDPAGVYRPSALQVISLDGSQISQIDDFLNSDERFFSRFGLPATA